jgi:hypothetical protein
MVFLITFRRLDNYCDCGQPVENEAVYGDMIHIHHHLIWSYHVSTCSDCDSRTSSSCDAARQPARGNLLRG